MNSLIKQGWSSLVAATKAEPKENVVVMCPTGVNILRDPTNRLKFE